MQHSEKIKKMTNTACKKGKLFIKERCAAWICDVQITKKRNRLLSSTMLQLLISESGAIGLIQITRNDAKR